MIFMRSSIRNMGLLNNTLVDVETAEHNEEEYEEEYELSDEIPLELSSEFSSEFIDNPATLFILNFRGRTYYYFNEELKNEKLVLSETQFDNLEKYNNCLTCPICMEDVDKNIKLPCSHIFCYGCIKKWLLKNTNTCPNCRTNAIP